MNASAAIPNPLLRNSSRWRTGAADLSAWSYISSCQAAAKGKDYSPSSGRHQLLPGSSM